MTRRKGKAPFALGATVRTTKGARFWGEVMSCYQVPTPFSVMGLTEWRVDVRAVDPGFLGTLHIYPATQLTEGKYPDGDD